MTSIFYLQWGPGNAGGVPRGQTGHVQKRHQVSFCSGAHSDHVSKIKRVVPRLVRMLLFDPCLLWKTYILGDKIRLFPYKIRSSQIKIELYPLNLAKSHVGDYKGSAFRASQILTATRLQEREHLVCAEWTDFCAVQNFAHRAKTLFSCALIFTSQKQNENCAIICSQKGFFHVKSCF